MPPNRVWIKFPDRQLAGVQRPRGLFDVEYNEKQRKRHSTFEDFCAHILVGWPFPVQWVAQDEQPDANTKWTQGN
jgi:hypothetical protein